MATKKKKTSKGSKVGLGLGIMAAVGAAAYFLSTDSGKKTKQRANLWIKKAKRELLTEMVKAKKISKKDYNILVDKVLKKYHSLDKDTAVKVVNDLKSHWGGISAEMKELQKMMVKKSKKITKKKKATKRKEIKSK